MVTSLDVTKVSHENVSIWDKESLQKNWGLPEDRCQQLPQLSINIQLKLRAKTAVPEPHCHVELQGHRGEIHDVI